MMKSNKIIKRLIDLENDEHLKILFDCFSKQELAKLIRETGVKFTQSLSKVNKAWLIQWLLNNKLSWRLDMYINFNIMINQRVQLQEYSNPTTHPIQ